jgi:nucleotide-binding universal stress UspA family protein
MTSAERVLVLCEHGRRGAAAIAFARHVAERGDARLTVVAVAPQAPSGPRCGNSAVEYNQAVAESVGRDLDWARERLGGVADRAEFLRLIDGADQTLEQLARSGGFDLVLLPGRWRPLRKPGHPAATGLSGLAGAEILIVDSASPMRRQPRPAGASG